LAKRARKCSDNSTEQSPYSIAVPSRRARVGFASSVTLAAVCILLGSTILGCRGTIVITRSGAAVGWTLVDVRNSDQVISFGQDPPVIVWTAKYPASPEALDTAGDVIPECVGAACEALAPGF
jgi:hypothetical protein